jgi:hypothetical protein
MRSCKVFHVEVNTHFWLVRLMEILRYVLRPFDHHYCLCCCPLSCLIDLDYNNSRKV